MGRAAVVIAILFGVLATPQPVHALSCEGPPPRLGDALDGQRTGGREVVGVFESRIVAKAPGFPVLRQPVAYETVRRAWGPVPADRAGVWQLDGEFHDFDELFSSGGCEFVAVPGVGGSRFWRVLEGDAEGTYRAQIVRPPTPQSPGSPVLQVSPASGL